MKPVPHEYHETIRADYRRLCETVGLTGVPLDIYIHDEESKEETPCGLPVDYPFAGYDQKCVHIPLFEVSIQDTVCSLDRFPAVPRHWDLRSPYWPEWRANLWHETIHQYEDQVQGTWKSGNEHGASWKKAVAAVAAKLCVPAEQLAKVVEGIIVPMVKAKSP